MLRIFQTSFLWLVSAGLSAVLVAGSVGSAHAAKGDCGQPVSNGDKPLASDALFVLRAGVSAVSCALSICDANGNGSIAASDALAVLKVAVGQAVVLKCPGGFSGGSFDCNFDGETSNVDLYTPFSNSGPLELSGQIQIDCGAAGGNGVAACSCELVDAAPVVLGDLGGIVACVESIEGCSDGVIDCNGVAPRDAVVLADHNIGACTGDSDCSQDCAAYCTGKSMTKTSSACEGYCQGESKSCLNDNECATGVCPGTILDGSICQCECIDRGDTNGSPGALECEVGLRIWLETTAPCGDEGTVTPFAQGCVKATTEVGGATLKHVSNSNNDSLDLPASSGSALACSALGSGTAGLSLAGSSVFIDSVLGDLAGAFAIHCE